MNQFNGGETALAVNATLALTDQVEDDVTYMIGYNNFVAQSSLASFQSQVEGWLTNARIASPEAKLHIITPIYSPNTNTITLQDYRDAVIAAVGSVEDDHILLI